MTLNWHIWQYQGCDGKFSEVAKDDDGRPVFLIQDKNTLYQAAHVSTKTDVIDFERIEWIPVWACDTLVQARNEAELMHKFGIVVDDATEPFTP